MDYLVFKYIGMLSNRLRNFKKKSSGLMNFSCPICGDSQKNLRLARGYIYHRQGKSLYHCHNCNVTMSTANLIKTLDPQLHSEYLLEKLQNNKTPEQVDFETFVDKMKKPIFMKEGPLKGLKKVSQLPVTHPIKKLVDARKIPTQYHSKLFACPNFKTFTNTLIPGKFDSNSIMRDETRLLIPFLSSEKKVHAYQGRAIGESNVKYITIVLDDTIPKVYGLDTVDLSKKTYVFEGPIDSMFLPNSIATAGGDLVSALAGFDKHNLVIVYDNESRSRETVKKIDKAIMQGYNVCIYPENYEHKDINDAILAGLSSDFLKHIIDSNTYRDLSAKLTLSKWSKL